MTRMHFLAATGGTVAASLLPHSGGASESEIALDTATGQIAGTLFLPAGGVPIPVVLIIAGSGPTDRNGNSPMLPGKNNAYKLLAAALAERGIASVRYDKRGIGASVKVPEEDLRFDTYVDDAAAWIRKLHHDARFARVIVAGHSEGALVGTIAVQRAPAYALASLEGAGRPAATILREQLKPKLPPLLYEQAEAALLSLQAGHTVASPPPELQALFRPSVQPYLISWFAYNPAVEIAKVDIPICIVQGTADVQVSEVDAEALARAAPRATLVIVKGMNHVLKYAPNVSSQEAILRGYEDPSLPVDLQAVGAVAAICSETKS
ncbi:MAG TPA: alpha/beta hydrolase [Candidatus Dormibacteraeota bacterium]|nr:alpha/beta hydrolase [Candidatus Dormibacteraeota bacterium]